MKHRNLAIICEKTNSMQLPPELLKRLAPLIKRLSGNGNKKRNDLALQIATNDDMHSKSCGGNYSNAPAQNTTPSDREWGTNSSVNAYATMTPGQGNIRESAQDLRDKEDYKRWKKLVNMGAREIQAFLDSQDGKKAGLSRKEAATAGAGGRRITSGRDSARAIIRMKSMPFSEWGPAEKRWMRKQISFISRMLGNPGKLRDEQGRPTRKLLSLKVWGHNPGRG
jgi:hypothetical protein